MKNPSRYPAFIIAGTNSSCGKTTVTLGIMEALKRRGVPVAPFKAGPDFIDPGHHRALLGKPSYNLDAWMMGESAVKKTFYANSAGCVGVIEGVMGLFDGKGGITPFGGSAEGSTAQLAKVLNIPILLVVNAEKTAGSVWAVVKGFSEFDPAIKIKWVVFNKVAGPRHFNMIMASRPRSVKTICLGSIPRDEGLSLPERHLGLVTAENIHGSAWTRFVKKAGAVVESSVDLMGLLNDLPKPSKPSQVAAKLNRKKTAPRLDARYKLSEKTTDNLQVRNMPFVFARFTPQKAAGRNLLCLSPRFPFPALRAAAHRSARAGVSIAVAADSAFSFYYEENLDILKSLGALIKPFSPLKDKKLPEGISGVYIGGGYPELFAKELEANSKIRLEIKRLAQNGMPIYAECGGLMYLGRSIRDLNNKIRKMCGVFPWKARMLDKRKALGYRDVSVKKGCPILRSGGVLRGHEFHYSELTSVPSKVKKTFSFENSGKKSSEGYTFKNTLATYVHAHFASCPDFAKGFVELCGSFGLKNTV